MTHPFSPFAAALLVLPVAAQDLCEGNGHGGAYMSATPAFLGGFYELDLGSPNVPLSLAVLSISDGFALDTHPTVGPLCLDVHTPAYQIFVFPTDATGNVHLPLYLPPEPALVGFPPFYSNAATFEAGAWSLSKTVPLYFELPDSWSPVGPMAAVRMYHTATYLGADGKDGNIKVLIAGGGDGTVTVPVATKSTEIFDPLSRSFAPGPDLAVDRATHTATRLTSGKVLIAGGLDTAGICHASCELYDPATGTFSAIASMSTPRSGHTATLLDDGRVLVTGGFADYQNPQTAWKAALDTSQSTGEIFDPATGAWTTLAQAMQAKRSGHTATKLSDGRVLLVGGVTGGFQITLSTSFAPSFTGSCEIFDPTTDTLTATASLPSDLFAPGGPRAFHAASVLADGSVLVTGGAYSGGPNLEAVSTATCFRWNGSTWTAAPALPIAVAWHNQFAAKSGEALIVGGVLVNQTTLQGQSIATIHDGTTVTQVSAIGLNPGIPGSSPNPRGAMEAVRMHDGAFLFTGGVSSIVHSDARIYTPQL